MMVVAVVLAALLVAVAAFLALVRVERGPSMLDRAVALDLLTASLVGAIAIEAAWSRRTETIPILVAMSLVGFVGSVVIARFAAREPEAGPEAGNRGSHPEDVAAQARASDVSRGEHDDRGTTVDHGDREAGDHEDGRADHHDGQEGGQP